MKKLILINLCLCIFLIGKAQVSKIASVTAGSLSTTLTATELNTVTNLTLTGTIDARDFKTLRDAMPVLAVLDISGVTIAAYSGALGIKAFNVPIFDSVKTIDVDYKLKLKHEQPFKKEANKIATAFYPANVIPAYAFDGKSILLSIILPNNLSTIGSYAFSSCSSLTSVIIPANVSSIGIRAFGSCSRLTELIVNISNNKYSSQDGVLFDKNATQLIQFPGGKKGSYTIPSTVNKIGDSAFMGCLMTSISIPNSVNIILSYAFWNCNGLSSVVIPSSVTSIGSYAYAYCYGLRGSLSIPASVNYIGLNAFVGSSEEFIVETSNPNYSSLNGVLFNKNNSVLIQYPGQKQGSYTIPTAVSTISEEAFEDCDALTKVTIPESVISIGNKAFSNCSKLTEMEVNAANPNYSSQNGVLFNKNTSILIQYPAGKQGGYSIPSTVNAIGESAFENSSYNLTSVIIPNSVTSIGSLAFYNCYNLSIIYAYPSTPVDLSSRFSVFDNINKTSCMIIVPIGSKALYQAANQWKDFVNIVEGVSKTVNITNAGTLNSILSDSEKKSITTLNITGIIDARDFKTMRNNMPALNIIDLSGVNITAYTGTEGTLSTSSSVYLVNEIPAYAFYNFSTLTGKINLTSITLPLTVTSIGNYAFRNCIGLTSLTIPSSVSNIGIYAFSYCDGLSNVTMHNSLNTIGNYAFLNCTELITITIPTSVSSIGLRAFSNCKKLNELIVDATNENYSTQNGVLFDKNATLLIQYPGGKQGGYTIPSSVTTIGESAFLNCLNITSINIPNSVNAIGNYAFLYCSKLTELNVDASNINYFSENGVLFDKNITLLIQFPGGKQGNYKIPSSVSSLNERAFDGCRGLSSISIPSAVISIGNYAFYNCIGLSSIYAYPTTPLDLSSRNSVFYNVNKITCSLYVPSSTKGLYQSANQWKDFVNIVDIGSITKTVNVSTAGTLSTLISDSEKTSILNLTVTGIIDARDFMTMRDNMPVLTTLDISGVTIAAYDGTAGSANVKANITPAINEPEKPELDNNPLIIRAQHIKMKTKTATTTIYPANEIPEFAFYNKRTLLSIVLPNSSTSIGRSAFYSCSGLTSVTIPASVISIADYSFTYCTGLTSVSIPASVSSIGIWGYRYCSKLTEFIVDVANQNYSSQVGVLFNKNATTLIQYPEEKEGIYTIPYTVSSIADYAFILCDRLIRVTIPGSVISLGKDVFAICNALTDIDVEASNPNYSSQNGVLFNKNATLVIQYPGGKQGVYSIPSSVITIGEIAFLKCWGLTSVSIPVSVNLIKYSAFEDCTGLSSIYAYSTTPIDLSSSISVYSGVNKTTCLLYVPAGSKALYQAANQWQDFVNIVENTTTSVPGINNELIQLFPNPVNDNFSINGVDGICILKLTELSGKVLMNKEVSMNENISISNLPKGIYQIQLINNGNIYYKKIIKK